LAIKNNRQLRVPYSGLPDIFLRHKKGSGKQEMKDIEKKTDLWQ